MERSESKYFITAEKMDKAFIELLGETCFEFITVKEICRRAGVNRSTFYLHYETIGDLLSESMDYLDRQFFAYFADDGKELVKRIPEMKPEELNFINAHFLVPYLNYVKDNRKVFQATLAHPEAFHADVRYRKLYEHIVNPIMERFHLPEEKRKYYIAFFLNGMISVINEWVRKDCKENTEVIAAIIEELVHR